MAKYAEKTNVSVARSKAEIEELFNRFGITDVGYGTIGNVAKVFFKRDDISYNITVVLPEQSDKQFWRTPAKGLQRTSQQAHEAWEQACRVKWRELALLIKAKLVAISNDAVRFRDEFLAYAVLPDRRTISEVIDNSPDIFYSGCELPALLSSNRQ